MSTPPLLCPGLPPVDWARASPPTNPKPISSVPSLHCLFPLARKQWTSWRLGKERRSTTCCCCCCYCCCRQVSRCTRLNLQISSDRTVRSSPATGSHRRTRQSASQSFNLFPSPSPRTRTRPAGKGEAWKGNSRNGECEAETITCGFSLGRRRRKSLFYKRSKANHVHSLNRNPSCCIVVHVPRTSESSSDFLTDHLS